MELQDHRGCGMIMLWRVEWRHTARTIRRTSRAGKDEEEKQDGNSKERSETGSGDSDCVPE